MKMVAASICIPKNDPEHPRGQDAHFIAVEEQWIGVADGIGRWKKRGIDSGVYANQLMLNSLKSIKNIAKEKRRRRRPIRVLKEAYSQSTAPGSSTACIISFSGGVLRAANVGDSGFLVIRKGAVLYQSKPQQHHFNCPKQLGTKRDNPKVAEEFEVCGVKKGDLVLLATDGVLDNMRKSEICKLLPKNHQDHYHLDLEELCSKIAKAAHSNSLDKNTNTPFSNAAKRAGFYHPGGKTDDITLVVARIE